MTNAVEPPVVETSEVEEMAWQQEDLGRVAADSVLSVVTAGELTTLIYPAEGNTFLSIVSVDGGPFEPHTVTVDDVAFLRTMGAAATPTGLLAVFSDSETFVPRVLASTNGIAWTEVATTGLDQPADISSLISTADGLFAAGAVRTGANPQYGSFAPAMWRSADGVAWESVVLPAVPGGEGAAVGAVAVGADGVVAVVNSTILRSTDNGSTWTVAPVTMPSNVELGSISRVAGDGEMLVAIASTAADLFDQGLVTLRSLDGGQTWEAAVLADTGPGSIGALGGTITAAGDAFWIATRRTSDLFGDGDDCYRDLSRCARGSDQVLLRSEDGVEWHEVDLTKLDASGYLSVLGIVDRPAGVLVVGAAQSLRGWTWPADDAPPLIEATSSPPAIREPLAEYDSTLTVGTVYRFPLYLHCGLQHLGNFNGKFWTVDPATAAINPETGGGDRPPPNWPIAQERLFGYITLVEPGTIEYSLPSGEVIAKFHPTTAQPALCS